MSEENAIEEPPEMKDHEGNWDEYLAGAILLVPFLLTLVGVIVMAFLVMTGVVQTDITIAGEVEPMTLLKPISYVSAGGLAGTYVLAAAKVFGIKPVTWLANAADSYRKGQ